MQLAADQKEMDQAKVGTPFWGLALKVYLPWDAAVFWTIFSLSKPGPFRYPVFLKHNHIDEELDSMFEPLIRRLEVAFVEGQVHTSHLSLKMFFHNTFSNVNMLLNQEKTL